ncbi:MAG: hypothetical protein AAF985_27005 [Bacteroidota bacterium]
MKLKINQKHTYHNFTELDIPQLDRPLTGHFSQDLFHWKESIQPYCLRNNTVLEILGIDYGLLFEEGFRKVPVFFKLHQQTCALFFIYREQEARKFKDAKKKLSKFGIRQVFYLSQVDPKQVTYKESALSVLGFKDLAWQESLCAGTYQSWWPTANDPLFEVSKTKQYLIDIQKCLEGFLKHFVQHLFTEVNVPDYKPTTILPIHKKSQSLFLKGPENQDILLTYSTKQGIKFHFPKGRVSRTYREFFLDQIHTSIQAYRLRFILKAMPKHNSSMKSHHPML